MMADHRIMIYGTGNLWDRSISNSGEIEISIKLQGPRVAAAADQIVSQYAGRRVTEKDFLLGLLGCPTMRRYEPSNSVVDMNRKRELWNLAFGITVPILLILCVVCAFFII